MSGNYRVYYRKGDLEIEVESTEKDYVDKMLSKLMSPNSEKVTPPKTRRIIHPQAKKNDSIDDPETNKIDVAGVAAKIQDANNYADIEKNILNKSEQLPRILLAGQFAHEHGRDSFTTGDIEDITNQLGIKINNTNVSKCITKNRKYFTAEVVKKKGAIVPYKVNRHGKIALDKFIAGEKP